MAIDIKRTLSNYQKRIEEIDMVLQSRNDNVSDEIKFSFAYLNKHRDELNALYNNYRAGRMPEGKTETETEAEINNLKTLLAKNIKELEDLLEIKKERQKPQTNQQINKFKKGADREENGNDKKVEGIDLSDPSIENIKQNKEEVQQDQEISENLSPNEEENSESETKTEESKTSQEKNEKKENQNSTDGDGEPVQKTTPTPTEEKPAEENKDGDKKEADGKKKDDDKKETDGKNKEDDKKNKKASEDDKNKERKKASVITASAFTGAAALFTILAVATPFFPAFLILTIFCLLVASAAKLAGDFEYKTQFNVNRVYKEKGNNKDNNKTNEANKEQQANKEEQKTEEKPIEQQEQLNKDLTAEQPVTSAVAIQTQEDTSEVTKKFNAAKAAVKDFITNPHEGSPTPEEFEEFLKNCEGMVDFVDAVSKIKNLNLTEAQTKIIEGCKEFGDINSLYNQFKSEHQDGISQNQFDSFLTENQQTLSKKGYKLLEGFKERDIERERVNQNKGNEQRQNDTSRDVDGGKPDIC